MFELLLVGVLMVVLGLGATVLSALPWDRLIGAGFVAMVLGLVVGVPAGALYHLMLYRRLGPRGALDARWWINPTKMHARLRDGERFGVMGWFYLGAVGFVLSVGGSLLLAVGAARSP